MEGVKSFFKIKNDIEKLANRYEKFFIRWQEKFAETKNEQQTKKLKATDNKLNEIDTFIVKLKDIKKIMVRKKNWKAIF